MPYIVLSAALLLVLGSLGGVQPSYAQPEQGGMVLAYDDEIGRDWDNDDDGSEELDAPNPHEEDDDSADDDSAHGPDDDEWDAEGFERSVRA